MYLASLTVTPPRLEENSRGLFKASPLRLLRSPVVCASISYRPSGELCVLLYSDQVRFDGR